MVAVSKSALLALGIAFAVSAKAGIIPVQLSTTGVFSGQHPGLNFQSVNVPLQNTDLSGSLDIPLGTFTLDALDNDFSGLFTLTIMFSHPDQIAGGQAQSFPANYTGTARNNNDTAALIFNPFGAAFNFNGLDGLGSFALSIDQQIDLSHKDRGEDIRSVTLLGHITNASTDNGGTINAVPEPSSIALLGIPVAAIVLLKTRRKHRSEC